MGASEHSKKKRPLYADMIARAEAGEFQVIVAYSNSRLTRRPLEFEDIIKLYKEHNVKVHTVVSGSHDLSTPDGIFAARVLADADAAEAGRTAERVTRAVKAKRDRGEYVGGSRPFGWGESVIVTKADGKTSLSSKNKDKLNPAEVERIRYAASALISGERSVWALCREFDASDMKSVRGGRWHQNTVIRMLKSETNTWVRGDQGPILDAETYQTVNAVLDDPKRFNRPHGVELRNYCRGAAECSVCGQKLVSGGPVAGAMYRCPDAHVGMRRYKLEEIVGNAVAEYYSEPRMNEPPRDTGYRTIAEVQKEIAVLIAERDEIQEAINAKQVTLKGMLPTLDRIRDEEADLRKELEVIRQSDAHEVLLETSSREAEALLLTSLKYEDPRDRMKRTAVLRERWEQMNAKSKRDLLLASFTVVVYPMHSDYRVKISRNTGSKVFELYFKGLRNIRVVGRHSIVTDEPGDAQRFIAERFERKLTKLAEDPN